MEQESTVIDEAKRRLAVEQAVRDFLHILDHHQLPLEDGLISWNMLGFTIFQEIYPDDSHEQTQERMIDFSKSLFSTNH